MKKDNFKDILVVNSSTVSISFKYKGITDTISRYFDLKDKRSIKEAISSLMIDTFKNIDKIRR